jgi:hypothetical protein
LVDLLRCAQSFIDHMLARRSHRAAHAAAVHHCPRSRIPERLVTSMPKNGCDLPKARASNQRRHFCNITIAIEKDVASLYWPDISGKAHSLPGFLSTPMLNLLCVGEALGAQYDLGGHGKLLRLIRITSIRKEPAICRTFSGMSLGFFKSRSKPPDRSVHDDYA